MTALEFAEIFAIIAEVRVLLWKRTEEIKKPRPKPRPKPEGPWPAPPTKPPWK